MELTTWSRRTITAVLAVALVGVLMPGAALSPDAASACEVIGTVRTSVSSCSVEADAASGNSAISADGRYVIFSSSASNLVEGDTNGVSDVFLRDLECGSTVRVSMRPAGGSASVTCAGAGVQTVSDSYALGVSADGRYVLFVSADEGLVAGDTNAADDIFVYDTCSCTTTLVSVATDGTQGNGASTLAAISADGTKVAFLSEAANLATGDTNAATDVFVRDLCEDTTTRVSVASDGSEANGGSDRPAISADGGCVVFDSTATNLVAGDTNGVQDVFYRDLANGTTVRVSVADGGGQGAGASDSASVSGDGAFVAFRSDAANLVADDTNGVADIFIRDIAGSTTSLVSASSSGAANAASSAPVISADGGFVAFVSEASNLVANDTNAAADVFVRDLAEAATVRASVSADAAEANGASSGPSLSAYAGRIAFCSSATNLVAQDTNGVDDVFVRALNLVPIAADDSYCAYQNEALNKCAPGVLGNDSWAEGASVSAIKVSGPSHGTLTFNADGSFVYTPAASYTGSDSFTYKIFDGEKYSNVATVELCVSVPTAYMDDTSAGVTFDRFVPCESPAYHGGTYTYGRWTGTKLECSFSGTKIKWIGPKQPGYGKADVYIDGTKVATVDCYASAASATNSTVLFESGTLTAGRHTISVKVTGTKNAASTGYVIVVDKFIATGTGANCEPERANENDGTFAGSWINCNNTTYTDGTYRYSRWSGAKITYTFTGTKVAWIGPRAANYGKAAVYIDGAYKATVSQYGTLGWRYRVWESGTLSSGEHTVEIRVLGTKQSAATGTYVVVDGFDVTP